MFNRSNIDGVYLRYATFGVSTCNGFKVIANSRKSLESALQGTHDNAVQQFNIVRDHPMSIASEIVVSRFRLILQCTSLKTLSTSCYTSRFVQCVVIVGIISYQRMLSVTKFRCRSNGLIVWRLHDNDCQDL